jgi:hypothetical protein
VQTYPHPPWNHIGASSPEQEQPSQDDQIFQGLSEPEWTKVDEEMQEEKCHGQNRSSAPLGEAYQDNEQDQMAVDSEQQQ